MKVRFCKDCYRAIEILCNDEGKVLARVVAKMGMWECPFHRPQCGTILCESKQPITIDQEVITGKIQ